jgi:hypothetical protein
MTITIKWCETGRRGWLEYDLDVMIKDVPMTNYKKWAKLFATYGTTEQHDAVLSLIKKYYQEAYDWLNLKLALKDDKGIKSAQKTMANYNRKYEILLGLLK